MKTYRLLLVTLMLMSTWMNTAAQFDGSLLAHFLPKKTFTIHDTRFGPPVGRPSAAFGRPTVHATFRQRMSINPQLVVSTNQRTPTFSQPPAIADQQSKGYKQPYLQQVASQSGRSTVPQPNNGARPTKKQPKCGVLPPTGECRAAFPRYYYNINADQCDCYLYGGCGVIALDYGYPTLEQCHASCLPFNLEEGPVCKEVFQDYEEVYFDPPAVPPTQQQPNLDQIPDDMLLSILINSVSPEAFVVDDSNRGEDDRNGRGSARNF